MKGLGIFTWIAISSLLTALIQSAALHKLWAWLVSTEYGPGPSFGAWFGIATILGLIVRLGTPQHASKRGDESQDEIMRQSVNHTLGRWLGVAVVLAMTWATGSLLGWVR